MNSLTALFRPQKLIDAVKSKKVHIKGAFILLMTSVLTFFTMLPVLGILIFKIAVSTKYGIGEAIQKAFLLSAVLLLLIPFSKWWLQSLVIRYCLRTKDETLERPSFSLILLGRSFGLMPMILLIPLKVLIVSPQHLVRHIFFPPLSAMMLTGVDKYFQLPKGLPWDLFVLTRATPGIRPSFVLSLVLVFLTYLLTVRKLKSLSELPSLFLYARVFYAVLLWDVISMAVLLFAPTVL